jgi:hypothetical protein
MEIRVRVGGTVRSSLIDEHCIFRQIPGSLLGALVQLTHRKIHIVNECSVLWPMVRLGRCLRPLCCLASDKVCEVNPKQSHVANI